jgi:hypothetical protein
MALIALFVGGCSYTFDNEAPDITLLGGPPNTDGLPHLNKSSAGSEFLVLGYDDHGVQDAWWVAFTETLDTPTGPQAGLRAVRLTPPETEDPILADKVDAGFTRFFLRNLDPTDPKGPPIKLTIRSAGQTTPPVKYDLPGGPGILAVGYSEEAFVYWVTKAGQTLFYLYRSDGSGKRDLQIPPNVDPTDPRLSFDWSPGSELLVVRDPAGDVQVHSSTEEKDVDLGIRPKLSTVFGQKLLLTCGDDGVRAVNLDGTGEQVLDPMPCDQHGVLQVIYLEKKQWIYYTSAKELWRVPRDGSGPPEVVLADGLRPLQFLQDGRIVFSKTPADTYVNGAGDGWLDGWRFMERGIDSSISRDGNRMRWLEHAATPNGAGELLSAPIGGAPLHLSLNTRQWEELDDGRILCDADHAFRGTQNRVVVIDEKSRTARWVASAAAQYQHIPDSTDLLIDVVTGPTSYDVVRVPVPPPDTPPDAGSD